MLKEDDYMAIAPSFIIDRCKDLSVEELENLYEIEKKEYCFESKEQQIDYIVKEFLYPKDDSIKNVIEQLLKEKTGKDYNIEPKTYEINLLDIINYVVDSSKDPFWITTLSNYFQKLNIVSENEKMEFLIELIQDKKSFNEFTKEIINSQNAFETYEKYKKIAEKYCNTHRMIG